MYYTKQVWYYWISTIYGTFVAKGELESKYLSTPMFHSEILSPWSFLTLWNGLPGIWRQLCVKMWFWQFSTHKIYVTVCGKLSELHFDAWFFSNPGDKVWKVRKTLSHSFPYFSNLLPRIGEKRSIKVWFWEISTHCDIYFVCGKLSEPHFDAFQNFNELSLKKKIFQIIH